MTITGIYLGCGHFFLHTSLVPLHACLYPPLSKPIPGDLVPIDIEKEQHSHLSASLKSLKIHDASYFINCMLGLEIYGTVCKTNTCVRCYNCAYVPCLNKFRAKYKITLSHTCAMRSDDCRLLGYADKITNSVLYWGLGN